MPMPQQKLTSPLGQGPLRDDVGTTTGLPRIAHDLLQRLSRQSRAKCGNSPFHRTEGRGKISMASCQRDMPKSHYFSGSAHAVGGQHIFILSLRLAGAIYTRIAHGAAMKLARRKFL